jgi:regulator of protease activity HflC (stomatin/prohibitin superfamily)
MKINNLIAAFFLITLFLVSPQSSHCLIKASERDGFPISEKLFKFQNNQGHHFDKTITQYAQYYPKNTQVIEFTHDAPTLDKKFVSLKVEVFWKISELNKYQMNISNYDMAKNIVWDLTEEALRLVIIGNNLKEIVTHPENGILENVSLSRYVELEILKLSNNNLLKFGIEIVNIEAKINYPL